MHCIAALLVSLALPPGLRAAGVASPRQARLDRLFRLCTNRILGTTALLQRGAVFSEVELDKRRDAVAGALLPLTGQHGATCMHILAICVMTLGFSLAVHDRLPAYQPPTVRRRSHGKIAEHQKYTSNRQNGPVKTLRE